MKKLTSAERRTWYALIFALFLAATLASAGAFADRNPPPQSQAQGQAQAQIQGQAQVQGQQQKAQALSEGGSATANGDQTVSFEDTLQRYNNPNIWLNIPNPTAPCMGSAGIGGAGGGVGLSIGGTKEDKECTARETARMFANMGQGQFALRILCQTKAVERAGLTDACPTDWQPPSEGPEEIHVMVHDDARCDEKLRRCESAVVK